VEVWVGWLHEPDVVLQEAHPLLWLLWVLLLQLLPTTPKGEVAGEDLANRGGHRAVPEGMLAPLERR
jgi:hypothetical protein